MTVPNINTRNGPYYPNGVTVAFPFTFRALDKDDVQVVRTAADGTATIVSNSLFDVVLTVNGGSAVFAAPPAAGNPLYVQLDPAFSQEISFENEGAFLPEVITEALDRSAQRSLWLRERSLQSLRIPLGVGPAGELKPLVGSQGVITISPSGQPVVLPVSALVGGGIGDFNGGFDGIADGADNFDGGTDG